MLYKVKTNNFLLKIINNKISTYKFYKILFRIITQSLFYKLHHEYELTRTTPRYTWHSKSGTSQMKRKAWEMCATVDAVVLYAAKLELENHNRVARKLLKEEFATRQRANLQVP